MRAMRPLLLPSCLLLAATAAPWGHAESTGALHGLIFASGAMSGAAPGLLMPGKRTAWHPRWSSAAPPESPPPPGCAPSGTLPR